jgi:glucose/arabinose dehydrogenase
MQQGARGVRPAGRWVRGAHATVAAGVCGLACAGEAVAQGGYQHAAAVRIASGLSNPVFVTAPPGDFGRLFIVELRGSNGQAPRADIRILNLANNSINATPFLSLDPVGSGEEQGLLGLAFDPAYASNGYFYINYVVSQNQATRVARYRVMPGNPDIADASSATTVIEIPNTFDIHNGGWLGFGPDGYLYIARGDGGSGGDPFNRAQSLDTLLGKVLRINVATLPYTVPPTNPFVGQPPRRPEIWAYGLRNPWRCSFDRQSGDLWIADVGQEQWEEVNFQPASGSPPYTARNYGWRCYEGNAPYNLSGCGGASSYTFPVLAYQHTIVGNECAVMGGYVYRGCAIPALRGHYFFADLCAGKIWSFLYAGGQVTQLTDRTAELTPQNGPPPMAIYSFGEDAAGELYFMGFGNLFKMVPRCYANCDASTQTPVLNVLDFNCFLNRFTAGDCYTNCDGSTMPPVLNVLDFSCFLNRFSQGCP